MPDSLDLTRRADLKLLETALRRGFNIPQQVLENGAAVIAQILADPGTSRRLKISAFRAITAAEKLNVDLALKAIDKRFPDQVNVTTDREALSPAQLAAALRDDPDYVEYVRTTTACVDAGPASDALPGADGAAHDPGFPAS